MYCMAELWYLDEVDCQPEDLRGRCFFLHSHHTFHTSEFRLARQIGSPGLVGHVCAKMCFSSASLFLPFCVCFFLYF